MQFRKGFSSSLSALNCGILGASLATIGLIVTSASAHSTNQLAAHYRLDGNALDATSNRLDGVMTGTIPGANRFGHANSALIFNGVSDFIDFGNRAAFNFDRNFTLTAWIKQTGPGGGTYFIAKYADYGNGSRAPLSYGLGVSFDLRPYTFVTQNGNSYAEVPGSGPALNDGGWHLLAMTYETEFGLRLYADGEPVGQTPVAGLGPFTNSLPLTIGKASTGQHFQGAIDDVRIYSRALSAAEIESLYTIESTASIVIVQQPTSTAIEVGTNATFTVGIAGPMATNATFQWFENGQAVAGATNVFFTTAVQDTPGQKTYTVTIHADGVATASEPAVLIISRLGQRGLLAHWSFDENFETIVPDQTGTYPGAVTNGVRVPGHVGTGALQLNGTNAYMFVGGQGGPLSLTNTPYSFSWWQQWGGISGQHQVVLAMDDGQDLTAGYQVYLPQNTPRFAVLHSYAQSEPWFYIITTDAQWHHYAVTHDGQELRFYADGILAGARAETNRIVQDGDDPLIIGGLALPNGGIVNHFKGILDDVRIYRRALSPEEVADLGPDPTVEFTHHPLGYNVGEGQSAQLFANAFTRGTGDPVTYQWFMNGTAVTNATNNYLVVTGVAGPPRNYQVLATAGNLTALSAAAEVKTIFPSEAKLLLRLDFEDATGGTFTDSARGLQGITGTIALVPGRVGSFAANLDGRGYIRVPAADSDLELVGAGYTIAWWMKPSNVNGIRHIYNLGETNGPTGYGARLDGTFINKVLRSEHRNTQAIQLSSPLRNATNWIHFAVVYNGVQRTHYSNGVPVASIATSIGVLGTGRDDLFLGAQDTRFYSNVGLIDDFRIYNYPLAGDEIAALANVPSPADRLTIAERGEGIVIQWPITEGTQHRVEYAASLGGVENWTPLTAPITTSPFYYEVVQPATEAAKFYRLRRL